MSRSARHAPVMIHKSRHVGCEQTRPGNSLVGKHGEDGFTLLHWDSSSPNEYPSQTQLVMATLPYHKNEHAGQ